MSILQCIGYIIRPLFQTFRWSGRASRSEFWLFQIAIGIMGWFALPHIMAGSWIALSLGLYGCLAEFTLTIRRLRHAGCPVWLIIIPILALVDFLIREDLIVCGLTCIAFAAVVLFKRGTAGADKCECISSSGAGLAERVNGMVGRVSGTICGAVFVWSLWGILTFLFHAYTVYVAAKASGFVATIITLILPFLSEIYWFIKLLVTDGFLNGYTIMLLIFVGCALAIPICLGVIGTFAKDE